MVTEDLVTAVLEELAGDNKWLQMRTRPEGSDPATPSAFVAKRLVTSIPSDASYQTVIGQLQWVVDQATELGGYLLCEGADSPLPFVEPEEGRHKWETPCVAVKNKKGRVEVVVSLIHLSK